MSTSTPQAGEQITVGQYMRPLNCVEGLPSLAQENIQNFLNLSKAEGYQSVAGFIIVSPQDLSVRSLVRKIDFTPSFHNPVETVAGPYIMRDHNGEYQLHPGLMIYQQREAE